MLLVVIEDKVHCGIGKKKKKTWRFLVAFFARIVRQIQENSLKPHINKSKGDRNLVLNKWFIFIRFEMEQGKNWEIENILRFQNSLSLLKWTGRHGKVSRKTCGSTLVLKSTVSRVQIKWVWTILSCSMDMKTSTPTIEVKLLTSKNSTRFREVIWGIKYEIWIVHNSEQHK